MQLKLLTELIQLTESVNEKYLYHATSPMGLMNILRSGYVKAADGPQPATAAQTKYPTVSTSRDYKYVESNSFLSNTGREDSGNIFILVFDKQKITQKYKIILTSQSVDTRGMAYNRKLGKKDQIMGQARHYRNEIDLDKDGKISNNELTAFKEKEPELYRRYFASKAGKEFEEAIVVRSGTLPLKDGLVGFYIHPQKKQMVENEYKNYKWFTIIENSHYWLDNRLT